MDTPCQMCGDKGYSELLVTCSKCHVAHEHCYCMREHSFKVPRVWICIDCSMKPVRTDSSRDKNYFRCLRPQGESSKPVPKWKVIPKTARMKLISPEEVVKLSTGATRKVFPSSNVETISLPSGSVVGFTRQTNAGLEAKGPQSAAGILKKPSPSSLQIKIGEPARQGAQQISARDTKQAMNQPEGLQGKQAVVRYLGESNGRRERGTAIEAAKEIGTYFDDTNNAKDSADKRVIVPCLGESSVRQERQAGAAATKEIGTYFDDNNNANDSTGRTAGAMDDDAQEWCSPHLLRKLEQFLPFLPALHPIWKGGFLSSAASGGFYGGFRAQPPSIVHQKAYKLSKTMPLVLTVELLPIGSVLEDLLQNETPNLSHVALYFFPDENIERPRENYTRLFENMLTSNAMIRSNIDGADLLIFTSKLLDEATQRIMEMQTNARNFLWGFFLRTDNMEIDPEGDNSPKKVREDNVPPGFESILTISKSKNSSSRAKVSERIIEECPVATSPLVWIRPPYHWVKLNVQGISKPASDIAGAAGIIRDETGTWACGYILNFSSTPSLSAELFGLYKGLTLLWERGYRKVLVETTNSAAVEALTTADSSCKPGSGNAINTVVRRCRELMESEWECRISTISIEQNTCAVWLADRLEDHPAGLVLFDDPPRGLVALMESDRAASAFSTSPCCYLSQKDAQ